MNDERKGWRIDGWRTEYSRAESLQRASRYLASIGATDAAADAADAAESTIMVAFDLSLKAETTRRRGERGASRNNGWSREGEGYWALLADYAVGRAGTYAGRYGVTDETRADDAADADVGALIESVSWADVRAALDAYDAADASDDAADDAADGRPYTPCVACCRSAQYTSGPCRTHARGV